MSYQDYINKREKGLCFCCDQPFHPMHQCGNKSFGLILVTENEEVDRIDEGVETGSSEIITGDLEQWGPICQAIELSLCLVCGISGPRTMKMKGHINEIPLVVLIDSGVSHNFVLERLVKEQGWQTIPTPTYEVSGGWRKSSGTRKV